MGQPRCSSRPLSAHSVMEATTVDRLDCGMLPPNVLRDTTASLELTLLHPITTIQDLEVSLSLALPPQVKLPPTPTT